ncbi:MAG: hypothetical protein KDJ99_32570, partial [Candidatus Competibacteraceae bacterium]|nr:hypothetical protein [Candidatus Competibacteraceae bacterium]
GAAVYHSTVNNNLIGTDNDGLSGGFGLSVTQNGDGDLRVSIDANTIHEYDGDHGHVMEARDGDGILNATVSNNFITAATDGMHFDGFGINAGAIGTDTNTLCADADFNDWEDAADGVFGGVADFLVATTSGAPGGPEIVLPGYAGPVKDAAAIVAHVQGNNTGTPSGQTFLSGNSVGVTGGGTCTLPIP